MLYIAVKMLVLLTYFSLLRLKINHMMEAKYTFILRPISTVANNVSGKIEIQCFENIFYNMRTSVFASDQLLTPQSLLPV